jgi:uncharacterized protein YneR
VIAVFAVAAIGCRSLNSQRQAKHDPQIIQAKTASVGPGLMSAGDSILQDADHDGIDDDREERLAMRFAPIVYHHPKEQYWPTTVSAFLELADLWFYDDACEPDYHSHVGRVTGATIGTFTHSPSCDSPQQVSSGGTRSKAKQHTYYLDDVSPGDRSGYRSPSDRTTYVHAYQNNLGGVTLQYWRVYAYNGLLPHHGGDWEGFHLVLDSLDRPTVIRLVGHTKLEPLAPAAFKWELDDGGEHLRIFSHLGGHTSEANGDTTGVRHETWRVGNLVNLGEKTRPRAGQEHIVYSGLWGEPGTFYVTGGYWGPAYNETGMDTSTGFIAAWCEGIASPDRAIDGVRECYPSSQSR